MLVLAAGVLASFTAFGYAQEGVTKTSFGGETFRYSTFLVLLQSVGNAIVAATMLLARHGRNVTFSGGVAPSDWLVVGLGYFSAHKLGLAALGFIPFPMQVVCKSCKAIPVMIGERLFANKKHSLPKVLGVLCMTTGVVLFALAGPQKKTQDAKAFDSQMAIGLAFVFGALVADGVYGPYQNRIVKTYAGVEEYHLMFNMNATQLAIALVLCLFDVSFEKRTLCVSLTGGELVDALRFTRRHPDVVPYLALFSASMASGNIFIYKLQAQFGALTVTTVTTLRKLVSVLFSVAIFGHALSNAQWVAVFVVVFYKYEGDLLAKPFRGTTKPDKKAA